jgi:hypothetical protein
LFTVNAAVDADDAGPTKPVEPMRTIVRGEVHAAKCIGVVMTTMEIVLAC